MKEQIQKLFKTIKKNIVEYIITNRLFLSYLLISIIGTVLVRNFTIGNAFNYKPFLTDLGLILLIGSFGYLFKPRNQFKYYFTWVIIFTVLNVISSIYYTFYTSFASFGDLATVGQVETVTDSIFDKLRIIDLMYIVFPFIFYFIHKRLASTTYYFFLDKIEKGKKMMAATLIMGALALGYSFGVATGTDYSRLAKQWNRVYIVERFGIIMYQLNDLAQSLTPKISSLFGYDEAKAAFTEYFNQKPAHENNKYTGVLKGYNIIFIHMESMQTFLMDLSYNGQEVTPNLNKLAKEGMFFKNFYPQVSTGTSSDSEFTLLTGLMPAASGTVFVSYYDRNYFTIPKYLKNEGYHTFSTHGNYLSMWNRNKAHPSLGYDEMLFEESYEYTDEDVVNLGINDYRFFEQALNKVSTIEGTYNNYMGTIITLSNHSPFKIAANFSDLDLTHTYEKVDEETGVSTMETSTYLADSAVGKYMRSANYADGALGEFLDIVKNSDSFNNTLFVFYGDHDAKLSRSEMNYLYNLNEETGEIYEEKDELYQDYDYYDHELNKKTPLIMWSKNKDLQKIFKGEIDYTMGMYNVAPTILNMFGLYNKYTVGDDIFNAKDNNMVIFPNGNILTSHVYYNNSTGEYAKFNESETLPDDYIEKLVQEADKKLEISNSIIVHNLLDTVNMNGE